MTSDLQDQPPGRRRVSRRLALAVPVAGLAVAAAAVLVGSGEGDQLVQRVAQEPAAAPAECRAPVGSSVPDCPVEPADVGDTGTPGYLPAGWALYAEESIAVPTGTADRVQSWQRRYAGPTGRGMIYIAVEHGDVQDPLADPARYDGVVQSERRPDTDVVVATGPGFERFLWRASERVVVDVEFRDTGLSDDEQQRVLRGIG